APHRGPARPRARQRGDGGRHPLERAALEPARRAGGVPAGPRVARPARRARVFPPGPRVSTDRDAAPFRAETGLSPREDIDTVVVAMTRPGARESGDGLGIFEGRFDLTRISGALVSRGATKQTGASGEYYRLADEEGKRDGAVALVNPTLI